VSDFVPERGDIVWVSFDPQAGHEQAGHRAGHRPALVLSPKAYNAKTGLMICCPMTTQIKGYPFEVPVADGSSNVALADQLKNLDWRARKARKKGVASKAEVEAVVARIKPLLWPA
jgi:mRNA interferase MazF